MSLNDSPESKRPVSVAYLVFGLVFTGIAGIWFLGQATGTDLPRSAVGFPMVLIGAGVIGLVASLAGSRRRSRIAATEYAAYRAAYEAQYASPAPASTEETVVLTDPTTPSNTPSDTPSDTPTEEIR